MSQSELIFTKMEGLGNDFVVIDDLGIGPEKVFATRVLPSGKISPELAQKICDRRFGIGADQILWLKKPTDSTLDVRMDILNADGTAAEMCGNGIRAIALYLRKHHFSSRSSFGVETLGGTKRVKIEGDQVIVDMGPARLGGGFGKAGEPLKIEGQEFLFYEVNVGNPHAVIFVPKADSVALEKWGPLIERHPRFPQRTNVEFVEVQSQNSIRIRVWERGAGPTLACGTGACASAVASLTLGKVENPVQVHLPGGSLEVNWAGTNESIFMKGPAKEVFTGKLMV